MAMTATVQKSVNIGGKNFNGSISISGQNSLIAEDSIPAAKTAQLTTRTDNDTGTLTGQGGHGIITGDKISIFWAGGHRHNVTVGSVSGNSIPIDVGAGDNLPTNNTQVIIMKGTEFELAFAGDDVQVVAMYADAGASLSEIGSFFEFLADDGSVIAYYGAGSGTGCIIWTSDDTGLSGLEGEDIAKVRVSHSLSTGAKTMRVGTIVSG